MIYYITHRMDTDMPKYALPECDYQTLGPKAVAHQTVHSKQKEPAFTVSTINDSPHNSHPQDSHPQEAMSNTQQPAPLPPSLLPPLVLRNTHYNVKWSMPRALSCLITGHFTTSLEDGDMTYSELDPFGAQSCKCA
jgi:hypothetical protein